MPLAPQTGSMLCNHKLEPLFKMKVKAYVACIKGTWSNKPKWNPPSSIVQTPGSGPVLKKCNLEILSSVLMLGVFLGLGQLCQVRSGQPEKKWMYKEQGQGRDKGLHCCACSARLQPSVIRFARPDILTLSNIHLISDKDRSNGGSVSYPRCSSWWWKFICLCALVVVVWSQYCLPDLDVTTFSSVLVTCLKSHNPVV